MLWESVQGYDHDKILHLARVTHSTGQGLPQKGRVRGSRKQAAKQASKLS